VRVTTTRAQYILKQLAGGSSRERLAAEYVVLQHLAVVGLPVAVPLLTREVKPFAEDGNYYYTLAPALHPHENVTVSSEPELFANIGQTLARLHRALVAYEHDFPAWTMNLPDKLRQEIEPYLAQHLPANHLASVNSVLSTIEEAMVQALANLPIQRIHGDCHGGNFLWDAAGVYGIVDLDHLPIGPRTYDIGHLLADRVKVRIADPEQLAQWLDSFAWLIRGYEREMPLTMREKSALWYSMLASQFLFIDWFLRHEQEELVNKNVKVLMWIYDHQETIEAQIKAANESPA
jgi:Ser/Thr protein kinase RdoA (MazF antagonist)